ncbi:MAG: ABC transporter permease [Mesorhizobium sp.]|nr:MAG: ABC transporter permease [Mesorhizobium sp.]RWM85642.1 MAG: ABC transporter permease [Mesorhizobium sp.]TIO13911.1 MAG: ABC transporter permease [Mesorhizobium sp.]TIP94340.1 MAG: ABC transporter permease [Mesorhizobium sp.]
MARFRRAMGLQKSIHNAEPPAQSLVARQVVTIRSTTNESEDCEMEHAAVIEMTSIRKAQHAAVIRSFLLVFPLVGYLIVFFVAPLCLVLLYSFYSPEVSRAFPLTSQQIERWQGPDIPDSDTYLALAADLLNPESEFLVGEAARRLNYEISGFRTVISRTKRNLAAADISNPAALKEEVIRADPHWGEVRYWAAFKRATSTVTPYYFLAALDLEVNGTGGISPVPEDRRIFVSTFLRSIWIAATVTLICLVLGYPLAYALISLRPEFSALLMFSVLLPFWTSLLVRTTAWIVVLSQEGIINSLLTGAAIVDAPLNLVFNRTGVFITMVHVLLPFMVLPILSVMRGVSPTYMKASSSLGAHPVRGFLSVYLPLTMPGIGAGCMMTFIIAVGYYVTPLLVGGGGDNMISYFIAFYTNETINWGMAAAIGLILLATVLVLYASLGKLIGVSKIVGLN